MAVSLKHLKTSFVSDSGDPSLVQGSDWNAEHNLTCASGVLLGRQTEGAGAAEEVPIADFWASPGAIGGTTPAAGTFTTLIGGKDAVNYQQIVGAATTKTPIHSVAGSDSNIALAFQSKGTGGIDLSAGSAGINISNGGTLTAVTRTNAGTGYTSVPSVAITAPTTPGGTQAALSLTMAAQSGTAVTPANGGTGYTLNDVLTIVGGTSSQTAQFTVTGVTGGVVTQVTRSSANFGVYTVLPTSPASTTGGTGTGCTLNMLWEVLPPTITNAGSGYLKQPQITFSGGGGSGAAAYATVGGAVSVKGLGTQINFYSANQNIGLQVYDATGAGTGYWKFAAGYSTNAYMVSSAAGGVIATGGAGTMSFQTNLSTTQMAVSHTASAVNYVQVTGAATGGSPMIDVSGADATQTLVLRGRGTGGGVTLGVSNGVHFKTIGVPGSSTVNYLQATASTSANTPSLSAQGTDTNINLALTPKGTGTVQFGTYTASVLSPTGYITITDSGGTTRRLLVG